MRILGVDPNSRLSLLYSRIHSSRTLPNALTDPKMVRFGVYSGALLSSWEDEVIIVLYFRH